MRTICLILGMVFGFGWVTEAAQQRKSNDGRDPTLYVTNYVESDGKYAINSGQNNYFCEYDRHCDYGWTNRVGGAGSYGDTFQARDDFGWRLDDYQASMSSPASGWPPAGGLETYTDYHAQSDLPGSGPQTGSEVWSVVVPQEHCLVKADVGYGIGFPGVTYGTWQGSPMDPYSRGKYNRQADTKMVLATGGRALSKRENLFCLTVTATEIKNRLANPHLEGNNITWGWQPQMVDIDDKTSIKVDKKPLGSDGKVWRVYADNQTIVVTPEVKDKDFYTFDVQQTKYYLVHRCDCVRQDLARTTVGVGELIQVYFSQDGSDTTLSPTPSVLPLPVGEQISWKTTAGSVSPPISLSGTYFTAPKTKIPAKVTATVGGEPINIDFKVLEPSGVQAAVRTFEPFDVGSVGAGMYLNVVLQPTTVLFSALTVMEPSEPTIATEYFTTVDPSKISHAGHGADDPLFVGCNNLIASSTGRHFDEADSFGWPIGVSGTYTYPIHAIWWVAGDTATHPLSGWTNQKMTLSPDGTMKVDKFGLNVTRHP